MQTLRFIGRSFVLAAVMAFFARAATAQDAAKVAPDTYKVTSENKYVRVLEVHLKGSGKVPMHSHPGYVAMALTPCKVRFTSPEGKTQEAEFKSGEAVWREAESHSAENLGTSECHVLNIEVKGAVPEEGPAGKAE